jgi:4-hydroxybenzoate polyprenyltransferase
MPNTVVALARSTHPGPTVAVTAIAVVLGVGVGVEPGHLVLLGLMVFTNQLSVGLSNDWIDADRDRAVGRSDKPVARGLVSVATVRNAAWITAALSVLLSLPLGPGAAIANAIFVASAWAYNAGLKNTIFSVAPYIVSFGLLPLMVTLAKQPPSLVVWWAMAAGAALGVAAHFANVLPDLEDDAATGVRGLPHRMGRRGHARRDGPGDNSLTLRAGGTGPVPRDLRARNCAGDHPAAHTPAVPAHHRRSAA